MKKSKDRRRAFLRELDQLLDCRDLWARHRLMALTRSTSYDEAIIRARTMVDAKRRGQTLIMERRQSPRLEPPPKGRWLYRLWSASNQLLYVGTTDRGRIREREHQRTKPWFGEVHHVTYERVRTRTELESIERYVIRTERPKYNIHHNMPPTI